MNKQDHQFLAQKIRAQYVEAEVNELDELRALDAKVKRPATVFGYVFGSISAVVMGAGMSLVMTDIGATLGLASTTVPGILVGAVGMLAAIACYPIYKAILKARKKKYADRILMLSEAIMDRQ